MYSETEHQEGGLGFTFTLLTVSPCFLLLEKKIQKMLTFAWD